ncbi:hypothetical protein EPN95_04615 [Patescibacteria group bacterium]|nr:MAG: hypothetical protein EPN95_04615 [Patescibacteria group bacterium]
MAIAAAPTSDSIAKEGLRKGGIRTPQPAEIERAKEEWLTELFNDIWMTSERAGSTRLKTLQMTAIAIGVDNQRQYDLPSDFDEELIVTVLDSAETGTAQAGTISTVTLAAAEDISQANAEGRYVLMTSGTSKGQYRQIIGYNATTKVASVANNFDSGKTPVSGDAYAVIDTLRKLDEIDMSELSEYTNPVSPGLPAFFAKYNDKFYFDRPLDKSTYGLLLNYYSNLMLIDREEGSGKLMTKILTNWHGILVMGIKMKTEETIHSTEVRQTKTDYNEMKANLVAKEIPFGGELTQLIL